MTADQMVLCYNKGCGKQFNPQQSADGETNRYLVVIAPKQKVEYQSAFWIIKILISTAILHNQDFYLPFFCFSRLFVKIWKLTKIYATRYYLPKFFATKVFDFTLFIMKPSSPSKVHAIFNHFLYITLFCEFISWHFICQCREMAGSCHEKAGLLHLRCHTAQKPFIIILKKLNLWSRKKEADNEIVIEGDEDRITIKLLD